MAATHSQFCSVGGEHLIPDSTEFFTLSWATTPVSKPALMRVEVGHSLLQAITSVHTSHLDKVAVTLNGNLVTKDKWDYTPVKGDIVTATLVPNDPLTAATGFTLLQLGTLAALAIGSAWLGYVLFKPEAPSTEDNNRLPSIRGAKNTARKYQPFRAVFGRRTIAPDYIAEPYTVRRGQDEWMRMLMCVGYGPLKIGDFKIGDTPLGAYQHNIQWIDHFERTDESAVRSLWPSDVIEDAVNIVISGPNSIGIQEAGGANRDVERVLANNTDRVIAEFLLTKGLLNSDEQDGYNQVGVEHAYFDPLLNRVVKIVRISGDNSGRYRPQAGTLIRFSGTGEYKTSDTYRLATQFRWSSRTTRQSANQAVYRSWTFPSSAILKIEGDLAHIDMQALNGATKECNFYNERDGSNEPIVTSTTYTFDQALVAWGYTAKSPKQVRGDVTYTPFGGSGSNIATYTTKVFPAETPDDSKTQDEVLFTKIRSIRNQTQEQFQQILGYGKPYYNFNGTRIRNFRPVIIALEVKATDQLSGMIDTFNVSATMCVPSDWNSDWRNWPSLALKQSDNPADAFRWLAQGPMTDSPLPNERIDLDGLLEWNATCNQSPPAGSNYSGSQWRISYANEEKSTLEVELRKIAFTGRAEYSFDDLRHGVVQKTRQDTPVQVFSPKNSFGFQANRSYAEVTDGIRFEFDNELKQYQQDENTFFDPRLTEAQRTGRTEGITLQGIPDANIAYRMARLTFYEQVLQREVYKFNTDIEGLPVRRGSLIRIQHDVLEVGLGSGRIMEIGDGFIRMDETINLVFDEKFFDSTVLFFDDETQTFAGAVGATFGLQLRLSDGSVPAVIQGVYDGKGVFQVDNSDIIGLLVGDFITYGELDIETIPAIVIGIEYGQNLECSITAVNYDENVYNYDDDPTLNPIPNFISNLRDRVEWQAPNPPQLTTLNDDAGINIALSQIYLALEYEGQVQQPAESFYFQVRSVLLGDEDFEGELDTDSDPNADWEFAGVVPEGETSYTFNEARRGVGYRFRARTRGRENLYSVYSTPVNVIIPTDFPVDAPENLTFTNTVNGVVLSWDRVVDPDLADYEIRTNLNVGEENGYVDNTTSIRYNIGYLEQDTTYYVFARTIYGVYSDPIQVEVVPNYIPPAPTARNQVDSISGTRIRWSAGVGFPNDFLTGYLVRTSTDLEDLDATILTTNEIGYDAGYPNEIPETYYIYAVSVAGYLSTPLAITPDQVYIPPAPTLRDQVDSVQGTRIRWSAGVGFPNDFLTGYLVRTSTDFDDPDATLTETTEVGYDSGYPNLSPQTYFVYAISVAGYLSTPLAITPDQVYVPPVPIIRDQVNGRDGTRIRWTPNTFGGFNQNFFTNYEVRTGTNLNDPDEVVTTTTETAYNVGFVQGDALITYHVYAKSVAGYYSDLGLEITPDAPPVALPISKLLVPIDNSVIVDWDDPLPENIIYPIAHYEVWELKPQRLDFEKIGRFSATIAAIPQREGGEYSYRLRTVDAGDNKSNFTETLSVAVNDPTDFVLGYNVTDLFVQNIPAGILDVGTLERGVYADNPDGNKSAYFPVNVSKTLQQRIDTAATESSVSSSAVTTQNKIDNVGPFIPQFTLESNDGECYYENIYDVFAGSEGTGLFLFNNTITTALNFTRIDETVDVEIVPEISVRLLQTDPWIDYPDGFQAFVEDQFRYVKIRYTFNFDSNNSSKKALIRVNNIGLQIDVKKRTEEGYNEISRDDAGTGGTFIEFVKSFNNIVGDEVSNFLDLDSVVATVEEIYDPVTETWVNAATLTETSFTVYTRFEDVPRPEGFFAYCKSIDFGGGAFVSARISWIARGV
jgi:hypothetical protein